MWFGLIEIEKKIKNLISYNVPIKEKSIFYKSKTNLYAVHNMHKTNIMLYIIFVLGLG